MTRWCQRARYAQSCRQVGDAAARQERDQPACRGSGLGLPITRQFVEAHGGHNRTGTLVSYSIASKLDDTSPVLLGFLVLMAQRAVWNYLPTRKHASFYNVWAGAASRIRPSAKHSESSARTAIGKIILMP